MMITSLTSDTRACEEAHTPRYSPHTQGIERLLIELAGRDKPFRILEPAEGLTRLWS